MKQKKLTSICGIQDISTGDGLIPSQTVDDDKSAANLSILLHTARQFLDGIPAGSQIRFLGHTSDELYYDDIASEE